MTGATLSAVPGSSPAEYQYVERYDCEGYPDSVSDYLAECDGHCEVCPEGEVPTIHACEGAVVIRCWDNDETINYELLWPDNGLADWEREAEETEARYTCPGLG